MPAYEFDVKLWFNGVIHAEDRDAAKRLIINLIDTLQPSSDWIDGFNQVRANEDGDIAIEFLTVSPEHHDLSGDDIEEVMQP